MSRTTSTLLACGLAPAAFCAVLLVEGAVRPGYDPIHHWGSELSLGPGGWVQITNFIVTGVLTMAFALGLARALRGGPAAVAAPVLTAVFGTGLVVAGIFVTDPFPGYPPGNPGTVEQTFHGTVHGMNALPTFAALVAAQLCMAWRFARQPGDRPWMWYSIATAVVVVVTFGISGYLSDLNEIGQEPTAPHGLFQRITLVTGFTWYAVVAVRLLRSRESARRGAQAHDPVVPVDGER